MISTAAAIRAAARILRAERGTEPEPLAVALVASIITMEVEIAERKQREEQPKLKVIGGRDYADAPLPMPEMR